MKHGDLGSWLNWRITLLSIQFQWQSWCSQVWLLKIVLKTIKTVIKLKKMLLLCYLNKTNILGRTINLCFAYGIALIFELLSSHILILTFKYTSTFLYVSQTLKVINTFGLKYFTGLLFLNNSLTLFIGK